MKIFRRLTMVTLLASSWAWAASVPSGTNQDPRYSRALFIETAENDPEQALALYSKIIADAAAPLSVRTRAWFRLGLCQERLGKSAQATEAFDAALRHRELLLPEDASDAASRLARLKKVTVPAATVEAAVAPRRWVLHLDTAKAQPVRGGITGIPDGVLAVGGGFTYRVSANVGAGFEAQSFFTQTDDRTSTRAPRNRNEMIFFDPTSIVNRSSRRRASALYLGSNGDVLVSRGIWQLAITGGVGALLSESETRSEEQSVIDLSSVTLSMPLPTQVQTIRRTDVALRAGLLAGVALPGNWALMIGVEDMAIFRKENPSPTLDSSPPPGRLRLWHVLLPTAELRWRF